MIEKPTIFFSHSSKDSEAVAELKKLFVEKTSGTIDVFLSSDGQSIPFGRNWVHEVQEALGRAKIMFVFLTPDSIKSGWIYFESGYCHKQGVRVIPVGFAGVDLNGIRPPLSLLQGFNLRGAAYLNNLINISNEEFRYNHLESFTDEEFKNLQTLSKGGVRSDFNFNEVGELQLVLNAQDCEHHYQTLPEDIASIISENDSDSSPVCTLSSVSFFGGSIQVQLNDQKDCKLTFELEFSAFRDLETSIAKISSYIGAGSASCAISLNKGYSGVYETPLFTGGLKRSGAVLTNEPSYECRFGNLLFKSGFYGNVLEMRFQDIEKVPSVCDFEGLLSILRDRGLIYSKTVSIAHFPDS